MLKTNSPSARIALSIGLVISFYLQGADHKVKKARTASVAEATAGMGGLTAGIGESLVEESSNMHREEKKAQAALKQGPNVNRLIQTYLNTDPEDKSRRATLITQINAAIETNTQQFSAAFEESGAAGRHLFGQAIRERRRSKAAKLTQKQLDIFRRQTFPWHISCISPETRSAIWQRNPELFNHISLLPALNAVSRYTPYEFDQAYDAFKILEARDENPAADAYEILNKSIQVDRDRREVARALVGPDKAATIGEEEMELAKNLLDKEDGNVERATTIAAMIGEATRLCQNLGKQLSEIPGEDFASKLNALRDMEEQRKKG